MNKDLTVGEPRKTLWKFCLPLFGSIIFQQMYNLADSFVAGKFIGEKALAAVGNSYEITFIFLAFAFGCNIGCSVVVAQLFGAKKYRDMKCAVYTTLISSAVLCLILMLIGIFFCDAILRLIKTPADIIADSKLYLDIYIYGLPFVFFYNVATGIFSALGDSKTPFWFLAASSTANIFADILFVTVFGMKVDGVAWATFICQGISCILAVIFVLIRLAKIKTEEKADVFSFSMFKTIVRIAAPSMIQQCSISVGNILIQRAVNAFGSAVIAGFSAAIKPNNLAISSFVTIGNGTSNFAAQNYGAEKPERIKKGHFYGIMLVWILALSFSIAYFAFGKEIVHFFLDNPSDTALNTAVGFLRIIAPFYFLCSLKIVTDAVIRGLGKMFPFMISTFVDFLIRIILVYSFAPSMGVTGIWIAWPISWFVSVIVSLIFYKRMPLAKREL